MIEVFTDGACSGQPRPRRMGVGGRARRRAARQRGRGAHHQPADGGAGGAGGVARASRAELIIVSDSTYVVHCFRDRWYVKWQRNGWKNSKKEPVANVDLWKPLVELVLERRPEFRWVKGHSGNPMNDLVDRLAVAAAQGPFAADRDETPYHPPILPAEPPADQDRLFEDLVP